MFIFFNLRSDRNNGKGAATLGDMGTGRPRDVSPAAAEVWKRLLEYFLGHRDHHLRVLQEFGLSPGDFKALLVLDADEPRAMRSLADSWSCDASNVTWMVDRLEQRNLVERRTLPTDRRVKAIALTPAGAETKAQLLERLYEPPAELVALDPGDLDALRRALAKLPSSPPVDGHRDPTLGHRPPAASPPPRGRNGSSHGAMS